MSNNEQRRRAVEMALARYPGQPEVAAKIDALLGLSASSASIAATLGLGLGAMAPLSSALVSPEIREAQALARLIDDTAKQMKESARQNPSLIAFYSPVVEDGFIPERIETPTPERIHAVHSGVKMEGLGAYAARQERANPPKPEPSKTTIETHQENRQARRYQMCLDAGLTMPTDDYAHLPRGIGAVAKQEGIKRQSFSEDVKAHIRRLNGR